MSGSARSNPPGRDVINLRIPADQKALIDRAAGAQGQSRTEFMLDAARKAATDVLLDRRLFQLSDSEFSAFEHQLDAPVGEAVSDLLASRSPWEK
ncbi:DUF1778 domain-containing protein [uncultured Maricaulis sp.]|uniref:type II toxin-antitoxin system TacA family antitoxin n=1 Tax=uncultured Maricaulis sp. TaxID=174710 RepID=UPI0030DCB3B2|tara:strand:+ start:161 stop:445 length:285 start_codon:yes stop_codon:yes gene_type:complete